MECVPEIRGLRSTIEVGQVVDLVNLMAATFVRV